MSLLHWLRFVAAEALRATLYSLYRDGPRSVGGWAGAQDATLCTELLGTKSESVWRTSPSACEEEIQADFQSKFVMASTSLYILAGIIIFWQLVILLRHAASLAISACCNRLLRTPAQVTDLHKGDITLRRHRARRRRRLRDRDDARLRPMLVDDAFYAAPSLPTLSSLSSSPTTTATPGSTYLDWTRTPSPEVSSPAAPARPARKAPHARRKHWPGTPARTGFTSDASM